MAPPRFSKTDVVEKAARLVKDGALGAAVKEYQQLFAHDPNDWGVANTLGDLYLRMGQTDEGIAHFMALAEQVAGDGYTAKARALYRKILRVQPNNQAAAERVVQLDSQHLDSNPFMQRMLDTVRQSQAAAAAQAATAQAETEQAATEQAAPPAARASVDEVSADPKGEVPNVTPPEPPVADPAPAPVADVEQVAKVAAPDAVAPVAARPAVAAVEQVARVAAPDAVAPVAARPAVAAVEQVARVAAPDAVAPVATRPAVERHHPDPAPDVLEVVTEADVQMDVLEVVSEPDIQMDVLDVVSEPEIRLVAEPDEIVELSGDWGSFDLGGTARQTVDIGAALGLRRVQPAPVRPPALDPEPPVDTHAECAAFVVPADDWVPLCVRLAAMPLPEDSPAPESPEAAAAFTARRSSALQAAAAGDFETAAGTIEAFLREHPHHIPALELLVDLCVDGPTDEVPSVQIRLAHACLATSQASRARQVVLDLHYRYPDNPRVADVLSLISRLAPAPSLPAVTADRDQYADPVELFDDDGLVTGSVDDVTARPPADMPGDPLEAWLDSTEVSAATDALARAERMRTAGNIAGASALLEALMDTPGMRPLVGVRLAQFYRERGNCIQALRCLELTAEQPPLDDDSGHALAYELALTLEAMGNRQDALGVYRELLSEVGPAFRDVAARADCLSAA